MAVLAYDCFTVVTAERQTVLVVEDDPSIREVISDVLEDKGFKVLPAANGSDALRQLETVRPDVMALDFLMPVMHGWAFMETYLQKAGGAPIPIVAVSVYSTMPRSYNRLGVASAVSQPLNV